ncbi:protein MTSS 2 isoform X2 [Epinephelus fuscoguttatus]|uniref:protein MTSS 2 isoform X3 n=1 Tax=Epinephelus lanceolatus TaxID=310571 RepID=UPI001446E5CA|nr:protein MTSS 2 isoform X3 [Epinephelus lanceolatus]XP_049458557.1 protein MTSS 2 isoform X2 [Epinephelus fuscoguttatus]
MVDLANMETVEKECGALGGLFQAIVNDMKCSYPVWEDFSAKATKLHSQLRTTVLAAVAFLDAFQKVADMATNTRGATRDIGSALTRMCMRHRSIEAKLRQFTNALMESLITPLQDKIEDWKKTANQLDKDHAKEYKRSRHEIKKKSSDTMKLQKKARKGRVDLQPQLDSAMQDVTDMCLLMEETEKQAVRRALVEERGRFCTFIGFLQPVVNGEIAMLGEITHLQAIIDDLTVLTTDPHKLPPASEQVIKDLKGSDYTWSYQTPPSSPSSSGSRKSSMCSSLPHQPPPPGGIAAHRLSSVSSHDSGFVSQDANIYSKPPSPMPSDITSQKSSSSASSEASETCQSVSECSSPTTFGTSFATFRPALSHSGSTRPLSVILPVPASPPYNCPPGSSSSSPTSKVPMWKDWSKAGQYEQPVAAAAVQRRKEPLDRLRENEMSPGSQGYAGPSHPDDSQRPRMTPATIAAKHGEEVSPAASDLAMVLTRGLSMEQQKSSRDSLQYSSGYSTETTTPSCSEDTIPSQGSDYDCYSVNGDAEGPDGQGEFDKSSTIPRHSNIAQNYRRMIQTKRPASTAGLPSGVLGPGGHGIPGQPGGTGGGGAGTPGTATIRRTPSTKPGVRRTLSNAGPIPIRPPIVPVKTPTVPGDSHSPGAAGGGYAGGGHSGGVPVRVGSEECVFFTGVEDAQGALDYVKASPKRLSLPNTAWGSGAALEVYAQQHGGLAMVTGSGAGSEEDQMIAANRHSLVEKIGELVASAHALGEGQFPFPALPDDPTLPPTGPTDTGTEGAEGTGDMLTTIRRGVRLRKTVSNDRSAPRIL